MPRPVRASIHETDFSVDEPSAGGEFPVEEIGFDLTECYAKGEADLLAAMIAAQRGNKYQGSRLFINKFGDNGRAIADAEDPGLVNYLVVAALHPPTIGALIAIDADQRGGGRKLALGRYGWGLSAQLLEFLQKNPEQTKPVGITLREQYLKLEKADDEEIKDNKILYVIKRGVLEKLAKTSASQDAQIRVPAQQLRSFIQPQIEFRRRILACSLKDVVPQIVSMEKLLADGNLCTGTSGSFQSLSYELLARAVEFQAARPNNPKAQKIRNVFTAIEESGISEGVIGNFAPLITFLNVMQAATEYGLQDYNLRPLDMDSPTSLPLAIDRIMYIATLKPGEGTPQQPDLSLRVIRALGHSARMFAEQAIKQPKDGNAAPLEQVDIQVRYPALPPASHNVLLEMARNGKSPREIHVEARKISVSEPLTSR